jgi:hypothetical protein
VFAGYGLQCYVCHPNQQANKHCKNLEEAEARQCATNDNFCLTIDLDGGQFFISFKQKS